MSGAVVDYAESFTEKPGMIGPLQEAHGPYHVSASRDAVVVHHAECKNIAQTLALIAALREAASEAGLLSMNDTGRFRPE